MSDVQSPEVALETVHLALDRRSAAFADFADLGREAHVALNRRGDRRSAVLSAATASEILMDDLLKHLLWEEAVRPEDAAPKFHDSRLNSFSRSMRELPGRIGGDWSAPSGPILAWQKDLLNLRHRVIHAGYRPSQAEASLAIRVLSDLPSYLTDRLLSRTTAYPRSVVAMLGPQELEARGRLSRSLRRVLDNPAEPHWADTFMRYKRSIAILLENQSRPLAPQEKQELLIVTIDESNTVSWVLHRESDWLAATIGEAWSKLSAPQSSTLRTHIAATLATPNHGLLGVAISHPPHLLPETDWVLQHRLLPLCGVMVDGRDRY